MLNKAVDELYVAQTCVHLFMRTGFVLVLIILCAPPVLTETLPAVVNLIEYLNVVPSEEPFERIPFEETVKVTGFTQASRVKLPVRSIVAELGTEI